MRTATSHTRKVRAIWAAEWPCQSSIAASHRFASGMRRCIERLGRAAAWNAFIDQKPFWLLMYRAALDLAIKMQALGVEMNTAQALILHDDLRDPDATARRLAKHLAKDIADYSAVKL